MKTVIIKSPYCLLQRNFKSNYGMKTWIEKVTKSLPSKKGLKIRVFHD